MCIIVLNALLILWQTQPVLRPLLPKQIRTYEKPQPAPKKQKTTQPQPQPAPVKTKPTQPQVPNTKDPKPVQATAGSKPQPSSLPPLLVPRNTTATTATAATVAASDVVVSGPVQASTQLVAADSKINKKQEEAVRQRIQDIKQRVKLLEEQREVNIDTQWNLFLEADALQKKKLELRAESHRIYSEIEREIFTLRKEYAELMCLDRKLIEEHD